MGNFDALHKIDVVIDDLNYKSLIKLKKKIIEKLKFCVKKN